MPSSLRSIICSIALICVAAARPPALDGQTPAQGGGGSRGGAPAQSTRRDAREIASDALIGTWILNLEKTKFGDGRRKPQSAYRTFDFTADGKILVAGNFFINSGYPDLARLNHDGTLDTAFADLGIDNQVLALAIARDGKIALGGRFQHVGGIARSNLARLSVPEAAEQSLAVNGSTVTWLRSGTGAQLALAPTLFYSSDNSTYAPLGAMTRISGGWRYSGLTPPAGQFYWLRAQAPVGSVIYNGSQGLVQFTSKLYLSDEIFTECFVL